MFDRGLTRLIRRSTQRTANGEGWPWAAIGVVAYLHAPVAALRGAGTVASRSRPATR